MRVRLLSGVLVALIGSLTLFLATCDKSVNSSFEDSIGLYSYLEPIEGASNSTMIVNKGNDDSNSYFQVEISGIETNGLLKSGSHGAWCLEWRKPMRSNNDEHKGVKWYSSIGNEKWKPMNYFFSIKSELEAADPDLTFREVQAVVWSLAGYMGIAPEFDLKTLPNSELPGDLRTDGQPNFSKEKVLAIVERVKSEYASPAKAAEEEGCIVGETEEDQQNVCVPTEPEPLTLIYTNPDDLRIMETVSSENDSILVYGSRNTLGEIVAVAGAEIITSDGVEVTFAIDDNDGRPTQFKTPNATFQFEWLSESIINVTTIANGGLARSQVIIDLDNIEENQTTSVKYPKIKTRQQPASHPPLQHNVARNCPENFLKNNFFTSINGTEVYIDVENCGSPVEDAFTTLQVTEEEQSKKQNFPALHIGNGRYRTNLPDRPSDIGQNLAAYCSTLVSGIGYGCAVADQLLVLSPFICSALSASVPPAAAAVFSACETAILSYSIYCKTFAASPVEGAPSPVDYICRNLSAIDVGLDYLNNNPVYLLAYATLPDGTRLESENMGPVPVLGPHSPIVLQHEEQPNLLSFAASPPNPAPGQNYVANASLSCIAPTSTIVLSIVGTDGYEDSTTCIASESGVQTCSLNVPGAGGGVRDRVVVQVDGTVISEIQVVFGS